MARFQKAPTNVRRKWGRNIVRMRGKFLPSGEYRPDLRDKGMTQVDLAEHLGVDQSTVSRWESGKSVPSYEAMVALAALFRCDIELLFPLTQPEVYERDRLAS